MYIDRTPAHATFNMILFLVSLLLGIILGLTLPLSFINKPIVILSTLFYRLMLYFIIPYIFFSLLISSYELSKTHQLLYIIKKIMITGLLITVITVILSFTIFSITVPKQHIISLISQQSTIPTITIEEIINNLFSFSWKNNNYASQVLLLPFLILAIIIGVNSKNIIDSQHPFFEICSGFRALNLKILDKIFSFFCIAVFIMSIYNVSTIRAITHLDYFSVLIYFLIALLLLLTFVVYPLLLKFFKIPISYLTWCKQILPAISLAFAGGNMITAAVALLYVEDFNNPQHKVTDSTISFSFIFSRMGTAVTIALSYLVINKIYTVIPLDFFNVIIIIITSILLSLITNAVSSPIILSAVATLSLLPSVVVKDVYLTLIPLSILLHCLSAVMDIVTCGFMKLYLSNSINLRNTELKTRLNH